MTEQPKKAEPKSVEIKEGFIKNLSSGEKHKISLWMLKIEREKKKYGAIDKL